MYEPDGLPLTSSAALGDAAEEDGGDAADVQPASAATAMLAMTMGLQSGRQN